MLMNVSEWMTCGPETVAPEDLLESVVEKMQRGSFRRVPVVGEGAVLAGIVTKRDLAEHKGYHATTRVRAAMTEQVVTVAASDSIDRAAALILEHKVGGLPVVDGDHRVVGIITTTDLLRGLLRSSQGGHE